MVFASLVFSFVSCDKSDTIEQSAPRAMELLYIESKGLPETSADSVFSFGHKFCDHMNKNMNDQYDEYFQPTVDNMVNAAAGFGYKLTINTGISIKINDEWLVDTTIYF